MAEKDKNDDKDEDIVVVTDDARNLDAEMGDNEVLPGAKDKSKAKQDADDKADADADDDDGDDADEDDDGEEARLGKSEDDDANEEAKAQKKSDHKSRRQRRKAAEQSLRRERDFLEKRNDQLERQIQSIAQGQQVLLKRQDESAIQTLDRDISSHEATIRKADGVIAEAITNSKGAEAAEATRIRDHSAMLKEMKDRRAAAEKEDEPQQRRERPQPDPQAVRNVKKWHKDNKWFKFDRSDTDSKIAGAIDDSLTAEGFDPTEQEYFDEFNKRIAKHLPHRALKKLKANGKDRDDDDDADLDEEEDEQEDEGVSRRSKSKVKTKTNGKETRQAPSGGPKFRTGNGRDLKTNEVFVSRERVEAMKELGVWDDVKLRNKYLARYRSYDKNSGNT